MRNKLIYVFLLIIGLIACTRKHNENTGKITSKDMNNMVTLNPREQLLANVKSDSAQIKTISETITLLGKATTDENNISVISSKVQGRVDKLFVRNIGEEIKVGQALYAIYSQELLSDENEYLVAMEQKSKFNTQKGVIEDLIFAAKKKLLLWGMSEGEIDKLAKSRKPDSTVVYYSKTNGYLADLYINEGGYVEIGSPLFRIAQSGTVWVEAQVYPYEVKYLNSATVFTIEFESIPDQVFNGKMVFIPPIFEQSSKISFVRVEIQNKDGRIKPGMMASVMLKTGEKKALVIPKSAITLDEVPTVWIEKEKGMYEMRKVHLGIQTKTEVEVIHGIETGEKVVSSGAYLINSAYILANGAGTMGGMKM